MRENTGIWVLLGVLVGLGAAILGARMLFEAPAPAPDDAPPQGQQNPPPEGTGAEAKTGETERGSAAPLETSPYRGEATRPAPTGAVFRACQVEEILSRQDYRRRDRRSLSEFFPDWKGR